MSDPVVEKEPIVLDEQLDALVRTRLKPTIVRTHALPTYARELPFHLDPAVWRTGFLEVHDGGPPMYVQEALRQAVPQAHLRDLYRPVYPVSPVQLDRLEVPHVFGGPGVHAAFDERHATRRREPLPDVVQSVKIVVDERARRRAWLQAQWPPHLRDDQPRQNTMVAIEPSLTK